MSRTLALLSVVCLVVALGFSQAFAETPEAPAVAPAAAAPAASAPAALTAAEKQAALDAYQAITTYDAGKVVCMANPWQYDFQPEVSPTKVTIDNIHDFIFVIICVVTAVVMALLVYVCVRFRASANPKPNKFSHNTLVEVIWTAIPIMILVAIGIPSVRAHYAVIHNEQALSNPDLTIKVVAHQWYWSYEYPEQGIGFDSNIKKDKDLANGEPRLLAVDNPIVVPVNKVVKMQITSADVIHAWTIPSFGAKIDAMPGKLNETWFKAEKEGIYFGQCSELCGKYHGFMPIQVHVVSDEMFDAWVAGAKLKFAQSDHLQIAANY